MNLLLSVEAGGCVGRFGSDGREFRWANALKWYVYVYDSDSATDGHRIMFKVKFCTQYCMSSVCAGHNMNRKYLIYSLDSNRDTSTLKQYILMKYLKWKAYISSHTRKSPVSEKFAVTETAISSSEITMNFNLNRVYPILMVSFKFCVIFRCFSFQLLIFVWQRRIFIHFCKHFVLSV